MDYWAIKQASKTHDLQCLCDTWCSLSTEKHIRMSRKNHSALLHIKSDLRVLDSIRLILQEHFIKLEKRKIPLYLILKRLKKKKSNIKSKTKLWLKATTGIPFLRLKGMWGLLSYELLTSRRFSTTEGLPGASGNKRSQPEGKEKRFTPHGKGQISAALQPVHIHECSWDIFV